MLAQDIVTDSMASFVSTFTSLPDQTNSEAVKWILDSLSFVVGIGSAFSWNVCKYQALHESPMEGQRR